MTSGDEGMTNSKLKRKDSFFQSFDNFEVLKCAVMYRHTIAMSSILQRDGPLKVSEGGSSGKKRYKGGE